MFFTDEKNFFKLACLWILGWALFRLFFAGTFPLAPDETNYWQWSRHPAFGYYDQAPLIAWAIKAATFLLGHTETGVRLPSILAMTVASIYLLLITRRWVGEAAALKIALLSQGILLFNVGGLLATPDGLQAAAWAGATYHVARGYEGNRWPQWLLGGLWFGIGMLSKYTMVIFLPSAYLYGLLFDTHRKRLAGIRPYLGVLLGLLMFAPVVWWNAQNNWSSIRHVAYLGGVNERFSIHLKYLGDYLASQAGLLSPLVFLMALWAWAMALLEKYRTAGWIIPYLFLVSFPMFAGFALLSLHTRVYGNWPGSAYLGISVLMIIFFTGKSSAVFKDAPQRLGRRLMPWAVGSAYLMTVLILLQVIWPVLPVPTRLDRTTTELSGWPELGRKAGQMLKEMPDPDHTFLFGLRYQTASEMAFYVPGQPRTVSINKWNRPNVYDFWFKDQDLLGKDAVGVSKYKDIHKTLLARIFDRVEPPIELTIYKKRGLMRREATREPVKKFYLYRSYGFKGGLRWEPPSASDIRAGT